MSIFDFSGKRVVVTGASRGLGRELALGFARAGADLVLTARQQPLLEQLASEVRALGREALVVPADLATREGADALIAATLAGGPVDVLINNAGYSEPLPFVDASDEVWERVMAINVMGVVRLTRGLGAAMLARGQGSVVMVGSVLGRTAIPGASPYITSKGAIEQLTRALGVEWARRGVRVNALAPGFMDTDMVGGESESASLRGYVERRAPMRRLGRADEVVSAALYLASDASSYVTGSIVHVDGGWTAA
ncbi:MAG: SDR family oxidoreductase [Sandaracinaceae bacterium]|jgi:NAD(P)-dependent dehydrogenase (short-subunit alcohol dehydrogenase family)|nr:SDR family oxidoreductase [Sandaracinaceae bacterium]MBP7684046.1 SDR family oxidoreductase [Deltaproteobacteria bacterium]MBK6813124.1 SDR family oxidoreductase [Sandaracinaceae bacterium]MBK7152734.1 SDR family oxidoreductase [Sandaracinaceae bacterium]MBK7773961.1 SDR family oxidoreductase [Sandaracinaceae bacterium]